MKAIAQRLLLTLSICLGIAVMLTVLDNGNFAQNLLYSVCIGLLCHLFIDGARVPSASSETIDVVNPTTAEVVTAKATASTATRVFSDPDATGPPDSPS